MKNLNAPAAMVLATTIVSFLVAVVAALVLVSEHTWDKLGHALAITPWTTVFAVGTPLIVSFISAIRQAWHGPIVEKHDEDEPSG